MDKVRRDRSQAKATFDGASRVWRITARAAQRDRYSQRRVLS